MAAELSSNWKKLQAKIKAEPSKKPTEKKPADSKPAGQKKQHKLEKATGKRQQGPDDDNGRHTKQQKRQPPSGKKKPPPHKMGVAQSSKVSQEVEYVSGGPAANGKPPAPVKSHGVTPSLALWAKDHDISPEDMAQAYGLGVSKKIGPASNASLTMASVAKDDRENAGLTPGLAVGKYIAIDCEMVGVGEDGRDDALARVSIVDFFGRQVYDSYVKPQPGQRVTDWRTHVSGVSPRHMRFARTFEQVREVVAGLLKGDDMQDSARILVGHDVKHDLKALELSHPPPLIRDTAKFSGFKQYGNGPKPALRVLSRVILGVNIQDGEHSSVEDARATMQLFRQYKQAFDVESANRFREEPAGGGGKNKKQKKKKR